MTIDTAHTEVERLVKKFKALSPQARKAYNEDNTRWHDRLVAHVEEMMQLHKD